MALTNEDINAWFSLGKVEVKKLPSRPVSSTTRAVLERKEREKKRQEIDKELNIDPIQPVEIENDDYNDDDDYYGPDQNRSLLEAQADIESIEYPMMSAHTSVFDAYDFDVDFNPKLTILAQKDTIISTIESNSVTVVEGVTGCGKSTQVPQYILESYARKRQYCNIICTQPRRIAATSVAKFVAEKRKWRLGSLVGYQIAMDKLISEDTRLTFVTTGVLLQKLIKMQNMNQFTHVILDEVHERDKDTDFCLLLVKTFLRTNSRNVKVVLMSATLESKRFADYFCDVLQLPDQVTMMKVPAPVVKIDSKSFTVVTNHLEEILSIAGFGEFDIPDEENDPRIDPKLYKLACKLIEYFDVLEKEETGYGRGTVLVFLPGMPEIQLLHSLLNKTQLKGLTIIPLHSTVSNSEQQRVFLEPDHGLRKVILATNIAESSITVPDIKYVIDFCRVKELMLDRSTNYQSLKLQWASKASLKQRAGRAGRVSDGRCYRLVRDRFHLGLKEFSDPEIKRVPLESLVLYAKQTNIGTPRKVLSKALEKPDLEGIAKAVINLKEVGALTLTMEGKVNPHDGDLTQCGEILACLPVDIKIGKLLILGHVFGILDDCLIIAAGLSLKPMFDQPYYDEGMLSYKSKMSWSEYTLSDCIAMLNAYKEWMRRKNNREFRNSERLEREWCERNFIKKNVIREVSELVADLAKRLSNFNIKVQGHFNRTSRPNDDRNILILKLVVAGAFYPNYFRWGVSDEEQAVREMSGHDPLTTVMISGLPADSINYRSDISHLFRDCGEGKAIHFESSRAYLEFQRPARSRGRDYVNGVIDAVYIALKKRDTRHTLSLEANADGIGEGNADSTKATTNIQYWTINPPRTPKQGTHPVLVTEVDTPGHFWVQYLNEESQAELKELMTNIRTATLCPMFNKLRPAEMVGRFCLALYSADNLYYRGYIKAVTGEKAEVFFVDYGNQERVHLDLVCLLPQSLSELHMQAFECYLVGIKPPIGEVRWSKEDRVKFMKATMDKEMYLQVYSEVCGTLRVILLDTNGPEDININDWLVKEGMALPSEEGLQSKQAHKKLQDYHLPQKPYDIDVDYAVSLPWMLPHMPRRKQGRKHVLKGPYNPYEVSFQSITRAGALRTAKIETDSVNSIVVDSEPQDKHERLMVASHINISANGNVLLARNTTLLPNIHGLVHIVCMIFAPTMELRTDELKRQYTGALCGLGFSGTGMSLYPDHDIELIFDCLITQQDIADINSVRHAINLALCSENSWNTPAMKQIQEKARESLLNIIVQSRQDVIQIPPLDVNWNTIPPEDIVTPAISYSKDSGFPPLLPLHNGRVITNEKIEANKPANRVLLLKRIEVLEKKAFKSNELQTLFCDLCCVYASSPLDLLEHLKSPDHRLLKKLLIEELSTKVDENDESN